MDQQRKARLGLTDVAILYIRREEEMSPIIFLVTVGTIFSGGIYCGIATEKRKGLSALLWMMIAVMAAVYLIPHIHFIN